MHMFLYYFFVVMAIAATTVNAAPGVVNQCTSYCEYSPHYRCSPPSIRIR